jgi:hypothetical protein
VAPSGHPLPARAHAVEVALLGTRYTRLLDGLASQANSKCIPSSHSPPEECRYRRWQAWGTTIVLSQASPMPNLDELSFCGLRRKAASNMPVRAGLARALMRPNLLRLCIRELLSLFSWELVILVMCHCGEWRLAAVPRPVNQARVGTAAAGGYCCFFPH